MSNGSTPDFDLVVVGGGIHGVGVAQAGAALGHRVLLLERKTLAVGTSSRSSKLIHGGLRYLESSQFGLVRESLRERELLLRLAPDLVRLVPFFIPVYEDTSRGPWTMRAGLSLYAILGGLGSHARFRQVPRGEWERLDGLRTDGLRAVFQYFDGQTDDRALVRSVAASAQELGAEIRCNARFSGARRTEEGYAVTFETENGRAELTTRTLINAGGPWVSRVADLIEPAPTKHGIDLVGGTHIELEGTLDAGIYYTEAPSDKRAVFHMPWKGRLLVGTTERIFTGDPAEVAPSAEEVEYLLETFRSHFPGRSTTIVDTWAGLRVLPRMKGNAFSRPREVTLATDRTASGGTPRYVGIYGGKLTGYRETAEKVLEQLRPALPKQAQTRSTETIPLRPAPAGFPQSETI